MKRTLSAWLGMLLVLWLVACAETIPVAAPERDELGQMVDAQTQATIAAAKLNNTKVEATTRADATRQSLILQGQQTRIAQEANATATTFAINGTATRQAAQATQTEYAAQSTATTQVAQFTATAHAQNIAATATSQAISVLATQVSASATATANAANAQATRISADATATVTAAQVLAAKEKAEWDQRMEAFRAIASFVFVGCVLIGLAIIIGFGAIRFIDAGVLRARVLRDKTGTVFVISEKDQDGRQMVLIPGRSPGAAMMIAPPNEKHLQTEVGAVDDETTKRDQAISLMVASGSGNAIRRSEVLRELTESNQIKMIDEPPAQIVPNDVKQLLDGHWKEVTDGKSNDA